MPYNETSPSEGTAIGGALAQLGERLDRTQEVSGSIPLCSTTPTACARLSRDRGEPGPRDDSW